MEETNTKDDIDKDTHRKIAVTCFNGVWKLLNKPDRTQQEIDRMIHMAHASRHHWEIAGDAVNLARGEWQISRVYSVLGRPEPADYHASRCVQICIDNNLSDFDHAVAYEAKARAGAVAGNREVRDSNLLLGREFAAKLTDPEELEQALEDLDSVP